MFQLLFTSVEGLMNAVAVLKKNKKAARNRVVEIELECSAVPINVICAKHRSRGKCCQLSLQHFGRSSRTTAPQHRYVMHDMAGDRVDKVLNTWSK